MSTPYTGNPANPPQGKIVLTEPVDGDADSAATFTVPYSQAADFSEMLYEQLQAVIAGSISVPQTSGTARALYGVTGNPFNAGAVANFIAVGDAAAAPPTILTSRDGITWTARTAVGTSTLAFAVGIKATGDFAVVLANGASGQNVMTSPDGTTWTLRTSNITLASQLGGVAWSPSLSLWCIVGGVGGAAAVATSPDGLTWTARTLGAATDQMVSVTWAPSLALFIACGYNTGTSAAEVFTSADGTTWTSRTVPSAGVNKSQKVYWSAAASLAMMISGPGAQVTWSSPDGINWTLKSSLAGTVNPVDILHTGRQWLVLADAATPIVSSIDNGTTWKGRGDGNLVVGTLKSLAQGPVGRLVIVGNAGLILTGLSTQLT